MNLKRNNKKLDIALITIHNVNNYGAVLQTYATQQYLSRFGKVSIIDYDNPKFHDHLHLIRFSWNIHGVKRLFHDLFRIYYRYNAISKFKIFISSKLNLTDKVGYKQLLNNEIKEYDMYVCGSDQIWNPLIVADDCKIDEIYFLNFAFQGRIKISFSSSKGAYVYSEEEQVIIRNRLKDFDLISVREADAQEQVSKLLGSTKVFHFQDPTLFLDKSDWIKNLEILDDDIAEKYILVYTVPRSGLLEKAVAYFREKLNLRVILIDQMLFPICKADEHIRDAGPKEFIKLFLNASFVITDSFHGTCFSVNFGIPFVATLADEKSNRISSLLNLFQLNNHLVDSSSRFDRVPVELDRKKINYKLNLLREDSELIIREILNK